MQIFIGDEPLNFELTETLPFRDILQKLSAWAESQNVFIIDYRVAAKPEFAEKADLNSDEIDVIHVQIGDQSQLIESNLRELIDYADRVGLHVARTIQEGKHLTEHEQRDLKNGAAFIAESLEALSKHLDPENADALGKALGELNTNPDLIEKINALAQVQNQLKLWLRQLEFSRVSKDEAAERIANFRSQASDLSEKLERVAAFLTQGKEQDALQLLDTVSQTLVDAVILLRIADDARKNNGERLIELLSKIAAAVDSRDLVTAADIVDFDLRDLLKEI